MSRSIAAASSCWPKASARRRASRAIGNPSSRRPAWTCATARPYQYRGDSASCGSRSFSNSAMAASYLPPRQQHAREVVSRQAKLRVRGHRLAILLQRLCRFPLALEQLTEVVARARVQRVGRHGQAVRGLGLLRSALLGEEHAVVVVSLVHVVADGECGPVVLLGLRPALHPAVQRDQVHVALRERGIARERGFVCVDGTREIPEIRQAQAASQQAQRVGASSRHACGERVVDDRPSRTEHAVLLERGSGFDTAIERAQRLRPAIVGRAKLGEERNGALEVGDRLGVQTPARRDAAEAQLAHSGGGRLRREPLIHARAGVEVAGAEQRLCQARSRR